MGVVYKAMDIDLDRAVALKLIAPEWRRTRNAAARFRTEARLAASLEHPNIVPVHRGGQETACSTWRCGSCRERTCAG